jgi:hypothetical protein
MAGEPAVTLQDIVRQDGLFDKAAGVEERAGRSESLGDLGDDSRRAENSELRAERGQQVTPVTLSAMIGMDGDLVNERTQRPLGADEDTDWIGAREGNHAAAAPHLKIADRSLESRWRHQRLVWKVRSPAAIQRVDEKPDVIGAAKAISTHLRLRAKRSGETWP